MAKYRNNLPQLSGDLFLTDGGIETTLIFHNGLDLPLFAAFDLLKSNEGEAVLRSYFRTYMFTAITMTYAEEAIGLTHAAQAAGMPVAVSFTVETDDRLPSGQRLEDAITQVDEATGNAPVYYMLNCAHPTHFEDKLVGGNGWLNRIRGLRANASTKSHAELDEATELDDGNPLELGRQYRALRGKLQKLNVVGGCCSTDHRHVEAIYKAWLS
jgi:S-methylmethionine-dependent homocysteine/selenocysteine methylase